MADISHIAGLIVAGLHPSPIGYADFITSTTHKTLRGPRSGFIISKMEYKDLIDRSIMPGIQGGPLMHVIAAKAVAFKLALKEDFKLYQQQVVKNAKAMSLEFQRLNYDIVSKGTDNHLFIINLNNKGISGLEAERLLEKNHISVSRSTIPNDLRKPWITSGIRIGTAAITTKGFNENDCINLTKDIDNIIYNYILTKNMNNITKVERCI
jgi:glycine hydroxymethyltransferase